jgi:hypothetical protein
MEGRPIKFRLLEIFDKGEKWNYEVVPQMQQEYGMNDRYGGDTINFNIIEICTAGFLVRLENVVDTEILYRKDALLIKYKITQLGRDQLENIKNNLRKKKAAP